MRCLQCGAEQEASARACTECGAPLLGVALESCGDSATVAVPEHPELSRLVSAGDGATQEGAEAASVMDLGASQGDSATVTDDFGVTSALRSRFEMLEELGRGGMGVVYKARDRKLRRLVALKRLHMATAENQRAVDRFWKEARSIAALDHANIVRVYNLIKDELGICIELEYVEGGDLQSLIEREGPLPLDWVRDVGAQLCDALALAQEQGIIHRDIKPANVLLTARGMPKLTDFGLARDQQGGHTQTGALMGTLVYAAPEQLVSGKHVDARSDLYALGATLYAMAVGETPQTIRLERLPTELREVIGRCLEENPERRFQTAQELKEALLAGAAARVRRRGDCPECGFDNPMDAHFCQQCGHDLSALFGKCPQCSRENRKDVKFCGGCGFNLGRHYAVLEQLAEAARLREAGSLEAALAQCDAALSLDPGHAAAKQAAAELRRILARIPKLYAKAEADEAAGRLEQAQECLRRVLELNPKHEAALAGLKRLETAVKIGEYWEEAAAYRKKGRYKKAMAALEELLALMPKHANAIQQLAVIREERKEQELRNKKHIRRAVLGLAAIVLVAVGGWSLWERMKQVITAPGGNSESAIDLGGGVQLEMVWIPWGKFMMGSPPGEAERGNRETQHRVTLTRGFWMGKFEVTQGQWERVMGNNPSRFQGDKNLPVEMVSWDDCQAFIQKVNGQVSGGGFRLPTEAEWEYACRARTTTPFHFGETISTDQANYNGKYTYGNGHKGVVREKTTPVGTFPENAWGLHDMHGNVWEWCQDWYGDYPSGVVTDPQGPSSGRCRVLRGGSWYDNPRHCRSAYRPDSPAYRSYLYGFRVARTL